MLSVPFEISWMQMELRIIERETCIRFVVRTTEADFVEIINGDGCWFVFYLMLISKGFKYLLIINKVMVGAHGRSPRTVNV